MVIKIPKSWKVQTPGNKQIDLIIKDCAGNTFEISSMAPETAKEIGAALLIAAKRVTKNQ